MGEIGDSEAAGMTPADLDVLLQQGEGTTLTCLLGKDTDKFRILDRKDFDSGWRLLSAAEHRGGGGVRTP